MDFLNLISLVGLFVLGGMAWGIGGFRRPVQFRTLLGSALMMVFFGGLIFLVPPIRLVLLRLDNLVVSLLGVARHGAEFLFGPLALNPGEMTASQEPSVGFIMAAQVLPAVIFFSALMMGAYYFGVIQPVIRLFARLFQKSLRLSGLEALAGSSNIFLGIESFMTVRPYLSEMTRSELLTLLTCGMSTVASTTLALYVFFLKDSFPQIAGHLISASILSIPAAILVSKLILPETQQPRTLGELPKIHDIEQHGNLMAALAAGSWDGIKLAAGITGLLVALLGVVGILDLALVQITSPFAGWLGGEVLSLDRMASWVFTPFAWLLGVGSSDLNTAGQLLGKRLLLTEMVAYKQLGELAASEQVSSRTLLILSYALCGFAHVASMGIFVGGISALVPSRRDDLSDLALRSLIGATLATLMTGALAGLFFYGQTTVLGL